jgi:hypothetical protein
MIDNKTYKLKLVGSENNGTSYSYPEAMNYLTYILVNKYKMTKIKILSNFSTSNQKSSSEENEEKKEKKIKNANKKSEETTMETIIECEKNLKNIFLLESCKNYKIEEDIFITIERFEDIVTYILFSDTIDLKDFMKKCIEEYKTSVSIKDYKYVLKLTGCESHGDNGSKIKYSNNFFALCDKLISEGYVNNFRMVNIDNNSIKIIDEITNIMVDDILINCIRTIQSPNYWEKYISIVCILESNTVDLTKYIEQCEKDYKIKTSKNNEGTIFYFKYLGKFDNELKFTKTILSTKENPLNETFDNIHNEHSERLINDLEKLKDSDYYKRTGLRKKKAYMFYGEPGCGKNASVIAMAIRDGRSIIDIPFSVLQYNSEFYEIMNITEINGISLKQNKKMYMFDEMHIGLAKICNENLKQQNIDKETKETNEEIIKTLSFDEKKKPIIKMSHDTLDLSCILSTLDGIGNYNGVIYIGLTNYIEQIPEPLKRSLRMTPIYFTYMRQCDIIMLIEKYFNIKLTQKLINKIPNRKITPARIRVLCEQYENLPIDQIIDIIVEETNNQT